MKTDNNRFESNVNGFQNKTILITLSKDTNHIQVFWLEPAFELYTKQWILMDDFKSGIDISIEVHLRNKFKFFDLQKVWTKKDMIFSISSIVCLSQPKMFPLKLHFPIWTVAFSLLYFMVFQFSASKWSRLIQLHSILTSLRWCSMCASVYLSTICVAVSLIHTHSCI